DGQTRLMKTSRSPKALFQDAKDLAKTMNSIGKQYADKVAKISSTPPLPLVANVRLAVDVAACDNQPLVVLYVSNPAARKNLHDTLAGLAWSNAHIGKFVFVSATSAKELIKLTGVEIKEGLIAVQPDQFGQSGKVLREMGPGASKQE